MCYVAVFKIHINLKTMIKDSWWEIHTTTWTRIDWHLDDKFFLFVLMTFSLNAFSAAAELYDVTIWCFLVFIFYQGFLSQTLANHGTSKEGRGPKLFLATISTRLQTFRHLPATLYVRWLPRIFNHTVFSYQAANLWDLSPSWITLWLIGNKRIWTRSDYQLCITSEPIHQVRQPYFFYSILNQPRLIKKILRLLLLGMF